MAAKQCADRFEAGTVRSCHRIVKLLTNFKLGGNLSLVTARKSARPLARQTARLADGETDGQRDRQTDRQTDKETD